MKGYRWVFSGEYGDEGEKVHGGPAWLLSHGEKQRWITEGSTTGRDVVRWNSFPRVEQCVWEWCLKSQACPPTGICHLTDTSSLLHSPSCLPDVFFGPPLIPKVPGSEWDEPDHTEGVEERAPTCPRGGVHFGLLDSLSCRSILQDCVSAKFPSTCI